MKPPLYTPREQEVLERPAGYKLHIYRGQQPRVEWDKLLTAQEAYNQSIAVEKTFPSFRALIYAVRMINGEERMAHVRRSDLLPLIGEK